MKILIRISYFIPLLGFLTLCVVEDDPTSKIHDYWADSDKELRFKLIAVTWQSISFVLLHYLNKIL